MKITITTIIVLFASLMHGQHSTGIILEVNHTSFTNSLEEMVEMQGRLAPKTGFSLHAFFNDEYSEKLNLTLGLGYTYRRYEIGTTEQIWPSQIHPTAGYRAHVSPVAGVIIADHLGTHDFHYISVPFTANYQLYKYGNSSIKLRAGITGTWLVESEASFHTTNSSGGEGSYSVNIGSLTNSVNLTTLAGLDIGIISTENFSISFVPTVGIELFSTAKEIKNYRLTTISAGLQVMF